MSAYTPLQPDLIEADVPIPAQLNEVAINSPQAIPQVVISSNAKAASGFYQVGFYSRFFDINTVEFIGKIALALNPFNNSSEVSTVSEEGAPTELYGFIWINATLVYLMFVSATGSNLLAQWLHTSKDAAKYEYNFQLLTLSVSIFYGYTVLVPIMLYVVTTWVLHFTHRLSLTRLISIYSYANTLWIPTTAANVVLAVFVSSHKHHLALNIAQWALVAVSAIISGLSILFKVRPIFKENPLTGAEFDDQSGTQKQHMLLLLTVLLAHLAFAVVIKFSFFGIALKMK